MNSKQKSTTTAIALLLVFSTFQLYVGTAFAGTPGQQPMGSLTTQGNNPITVNGASAVSGATILTGANIETPAGVGATVNLGPLGSLQIDPNTKLALDFQNGSVRVMLLQGCVVLNTKQGTTGEVDTSKGVAGKRDATADAEISTCAPGSVATAPAAAGGGRGGLFGLGTAATVAILGGGGAVIAALIAGRGDNPSPATP